jgi:hypothetical protein
MLVIGMAQGEFAVPSDQEQSEDHEKATGDENRGSEWCDALHRQSFQRRHDGVLVMEWSRPGRLFVRIAQVGLSALSSVYAACREQRDA